MKITTNKDRFKAKDLSYLFDDKEAEESFISQIEIQDECWIWQGPTEFLGYGSFRHNGKAVKAHRAAKAIFLKEISPLKCLHLCHKRDCVNPLHTYFGTQHDNMKDMQEAGRGYWSNKTHCKNGHELFGDNVRWDLRDGRSWRRRCLACKRENIRKYRENKKLEKQRMQNEKRNDSYNDRQLSFDAAGDC